MAQRIEIDLSQRTLTLWDDGTVTERYPVAIGRPASPTPVGRFTITRKARVSDPTYGYRWLGLNVPGYGIHGTNQPGSIGRAVSRGCVRLQNDQMAALFDQVSVGTPVVIHP